MTGKNHVTRCPCPECDGEGEYDIGNGYMFQCENCFGIGTVECEGEVAVGTDIDGWVQIRDREYNVSERWKTVVNISPILTRNYRLFGILFGVRAFDEDRPLFAERGWPEPEPFRDNAVIERAMTECTLHKTWCSLKEIYEIDPEDEVLYHDGKETTSVGKIMEESRFRNLEKIMGTLGMLYGEENVRLLVAFDMLGANHEPM